MVFMLIYGSSFGVAAYRPAISDLSGARSRGENARISNDEFVCLRRNRSLADIMISARLIWRRLRMHLKLCRGVLMMSA